MIIPNGKGLYIWQIWTLLGSTPENIKYEEIVDAITQAEFSHVYIKLADGSYPYNVCWQNYPYWSGAILEDYAAKLAGLLISAGIEVYGWHYVRGDRPLDEAAIIIKRIQDTKAVGLGIDAEKEYKLAGKWRSAETYSNELRSALPNLSIALSSYRYPESHREIPYLQFLRVCNFINQQLYWEQLHNPVEQLEKSLDQYNKLMDNLKINILPQCPIGSAYSRGTWRPTGTDINSFLKASRDKGLPSASLYSMDWMTNSKNPHDLWEEAKKFSWIPKERKLWDSLSTNDQLGLVQKYGLVDSKGYLLVDY